MSDTFFKGYLYLKNGQTPITVRVQAGREFSATSFTKSSIHSFGLLPAGMVYIQGNRIECLVVTDKKVKQ